MLDLFYVRNIQMLSNCEANRTTYRLKIRCLCGICVVFLALTWGNQLKNHNLHHLGFFKELKTQHQYSADFKLNF